MCVLFMFTVQCLAVVLCFVTGNVFYLCLNVRLAVHATKLPHRDEALAFSSSFYTYVHLRRPLSFPLD